MWLKGELEPYPFYSFIFNILTMRHCDTRLFKTGTETSRPFIYQSPRAQISEKWLTNWKSSREIEQCNLFCVSFSIRLPVSLHVVLILQKVIYSFSHSCKMWHKIFFVWGCFRPSLCDQCHADVNIPPTLPPLVQWRRYGHRVAIPGTRNLLPSKVRRTDTMHWSRSEGWEAISPREVVNFTMRLNFGN